MIGDEARCDGEESPADGGVQPEAATARLSERERVRARVLSADNGTRAAVMRRRRFEPHVCRLLLARPTVAKEVKDESGARDTERSAGRSQAEGDRSDRPETAMATHLRQGENYDRDTRQAVDADRHELAPPGPIGQESPDRIEQRLDCEHQCGEELASISCTSKPRARKKMDPVCAAPSSANPPTRNGTRMRQRYWLSCRGVTAGARSGSPFADAIRPDAIKVPEPRGSVSPTIVSIPTQEMWLQCKHSAWYQILFFRNGCAAAFGRAPLKPGCMVYAQGEREGEAFSPLSFFFNRLAYL